MKILYTYLKFFTFIILWFVTVYSPAQTVEYLNANNVNAGIGIGGNLFTLFTDSTPHVPPVADFQLMEVPKGSGKKPVFTSALWLTARDNGGNLLCAAQTYKQYGVDFFDGPIVTNYNSVYDNYYHRVFKVTKAEIEHFKSFSVPVPVSQIDSNIWKWPAKGNPFVAANYGVNINAPLAPFVDVDGDQIYSPEHGDYPAICGDEAIFFVFNDARGLHTQSNGASLGVEVRGLAEVYNDSSSTDFTYEKRALNNTVFVNYEIENKSLYNYNDFYLGLFEDPDLGCFDNDRVGCDTVKNLMFVFNGSTPDLDCQGELGYQPYQASHGVKMLNHNMSDFVYFTGVGAPPSTSVPFNSTQYRNYQTGYWNDGTPFTEGGTGYGGIVPVKYIFPGDPNSTTQWSEVQTGGVLAPGDRRMCGSIGPTAFNAGEIKHFDFAFTTSYDSTATMLTIVDTLKRDADIVQRFYNNQIVSCKTQLATGINEVPFGNNLQVLLFPNPANTVLNISANGLQIQQISIYNTDGKLVSNTKQPHNNRIDISRLATGIYIAEIKINGETKRVRWVKM